MSDNQLKLAYGILYVAYAVYITVRSDRYGTVFILLVTVKVSYDLRLSGLGKFYLLDQKEDTNNLRITQKLISKVLVKGCIDVGDRC